MLKVLLLNNSPKSANATDQIIRQLPMVTAKLKRDSEGNVEIDKEGWATVISDDIDFVAFALKNQGYVKEVMK